MIKLAQLGTEFLFEIGNQLIHDGLDLLVTHRLLRVLQDEVDGIRLLAGRQVLTLIDIEKLYFLQQFLLRLTGYLLNLRKLHVLVNE